MKRLLGSMTALTMAVLLAGCGQTEQPDNEQNLNSNDGIYQEEQAEQPDNEQDGDNRDGIHQEEQTGPPYNELDVDKYVTLGDYSNVMSLVDPIAVDENILAQLALSLYNDYVTEEYGVKDRAVELGDTVIIDYLGKRDGVAFAGGTDEGATLTIGSGRFINGFEDGLIGVMPGETVDLELSFPNPYPPNPDLAGQPVVFTVTVRYIMPASIGDMRDEQVALLGIVDISTVEDFRQYVYDYLYEQARLDEEYTIVDQLVLMSTFEELPEYLVADAEEYILNALTLEAQSYDVTADIYSNYYYGMDAAVFAETCAPENVKRDLVMQAIANKEGLTVSDEELQASLEEFIEITGFSSVEEFLTANNMDREDFRDYLRNDKVFEFLREQ